MDKTNTEATDNKNEKVPRFVITKPIIKVAILVDGGFYRKRANEEFGKKTAEERARELNIYCNNHLISDYEQKILYKVFYYDCSPIEAKVYHPYLKKDIDTKDTDIYKWMTQFLCALKNKRKFCLRLGRLSIKNKKYIIRQSVVDKLFNGKKKIEDIQENDFVLNLTQKGVDMQIGIDIASLSYKKQVDQIILISDDSDLVPATKLARREGIDLILDPMRNNVNEKLREHIDGIRTTTPNLKKDNQNTQKDNDYDTEI